MQKQSAFFAGKARFFSKVSALLPLVALFLLLSACTEAGPTANLSASDAELAADLAEIPQDPFYFARLLGPNDASAPLLRQGQDEEAAARAIEMFFSPWGLSKASSKLYDALWGYYWLKPERGFMENLRPYSRERWQELSENADILNYPSRALAAISLERIDLRLMPTQSPYFFEPARAGQGYPFDYYQNSSLPMGTPLLITHLSKDGAWALIESPSAGGWVERDKLALVDAEFIIAWKSLPMGTITRENVPLTPLAKASAQPKAQALSDDDFLSEPSAAVGLPLAPHFVSIGTVLALEPFPKGFGKLGDGMTALYYPVMNEKGYARLQKAVLPKDVVSAWPLPLSKENMASLMAQMMGQPYGWGGYGGNRDCSSTLRDLYLAFGAWLPRNSRAQAGLGEGMDLSKLSAAQKEDAILREGQPFLSLVGMPGHIALYLGEYEGRAIIFHNMWGLRTKQAGSSAQGRAIIGKAVITSLTLGRERGDIAKPNSLLDGVNRLSFPLSSKNP